MLTVSGVAKSYNERELFSGVSFAVGRGDCIAVIGRNGTGKANLFEIIADNIVPDSGNVSVRRNTVIGYLRQECGFIGGFEGTLCEVPRSEHNR